MVLLLAAASLLPIYAQDYTGLWSYNNKFTTELYRSKGDSSYCVLKTAIGVSSDGIEYRLGFTFGDRNEISLSTPSKLVAAGPAEITADYDAYTMSDVSSASIGTVAVLRWSLSRSMMAKLLASLKSSQAAALDLPLSAATVRFAIPLDDGEATFAGAKACEDYRLGKVLPD